MGVSKGDHSNTKSAATPGESGPLDQPPGYPGDDPQPNKADSFIQNPYWTPTRRWLLAGAPRDTALTTDPGPPASRMGPCTQVTDLRDPCFLQVPRTQVPVVYAVLQKKSLSFRKV